MQNVIITYRDITPQEYKAVCRAFSENILSNKSSLRYRVFDIGNLLLPKYKIEHWKDAVSNLLYKSTENFLPHKQESSLDEVLQSFSDFFNTVGEEFNDLGQAVLIKRMHPHYDKELKQALYATQRSLTWSLNYLSKGSDYINFQGHFWSSRYKDFSNTYYIGQII